MSVFLEVQSYYNCLHVSVWELENVKISNFTQNIASNYFRVLVVHSYFNTFNQFVIVSISPLSMNLILTVQTHRCCQRQLFHCNGSLINGFLRSFVNFCYVL